MPEPPVHYRDHLDLPPFAVEDFVDRPKVRPFHLMVLALIEHGAPMTLGEIVFRLFEAGADEERTSAYALQKAWHGLKPVYKGPDNRFGLILDCRELRSLIFDLELRPRTPRAEPAPPLPQPPSDDMPLTREEVDAAFRGGHLFGLSPKRQAAALLDIVGGGPVAVDRLEAVMAQLAKYRHPIESKNLAYWRGDLVRVLPEGLALNRGSAELHPMRQAIRKLAAPVLARNARSAQFAEVQEAQEAERRRAEQVAAADDARRRRALVHVVPGPESIQAAVVLNLVDRSFECFSPGDVTRLAGHLAGFDVLIGLFVRDVVIGLGQSADKWILLDLQPPQKRLRLNKQGRTLKITPELLIAGTTGISRPLGDPAKIAEYLATGDMKKLARRLESDAKALHAFYRYGVLHGCVRLRWGFKDETFGVEWALPSDVKLNAVLEASVETGEAIELVTGTAPGWAEPWSRAQRGRVIKFLPVWHPVVFSSERGDEHLDWLDIQAARPADSSRAAMRFLEDS